MTNRIRIVLLFVALLSLPACGYKIGKAMAAPAGVRSISIPAFVNQTYEPGVERAFTDAARAELLRSGVVAIVATRGDADLLGEVIAYQTTPTAPTALPGGGGKLIPQRYRARATVYVSLVIPETGEVLWQDKISSVADFDAGGAEGFEGITRKANQDVVLRAMASQIMREAAARMLADF